MTPSATARSGRPRGVLPATLGPATVSTHPVTLAVDSLGTVSGGSASVDSSSRLVNHKRLQAPAGICVDRDGHIYVADSGNCRILKILPDSAGTAVVIAGGGGYGLRDGPGATSRFTCPMYLAHDGFEALYVTDQHTIRRIACPSGDVTTLAGTAQCGHVDGPAAHARFHNLRGIAVDAEGNVFVADSSNHCIRMLNVDGTVTTLAGSPHSGASSAGYKDAVVAGEAKFRHPCGVAVDQDGGVVVADAENNRLRKIDRSTGAVTTIAGDGVAGHADDVALVAHLNHPQGIALDGDGNIVIADLDNHRVRMLTPHGVVTTMAGHGTAGDRDHETGRNAQFFDPHGVVVTSRGDVLVTEGSSNKVRVIKAGLQPPHRFIASAKSTFCADMLAMLASDEYSDVTFTVCGERMTAHRSVLSARCDHFRRMLSSGMVEERTRCVEITDTTPEAFRCFLKYLYTDHMPERVAVPSASATPGGSGAGEGTGGSGSRTSTPGPPPGAPPVEHVDEVVLHLLLLGRKYFVPRLFQQSCDHVRRNLCCANALSLLAWSEDQAVEELRPRVYRFVMQNLRTILAQHPETVRCVEGRSELLVHMLVAQSTDKTLA